MERTIKMIKSYTDKERGQVLITILVILALAVSLITSALSINSTALKAGVHYRNSISQLYAADSGANYALWMLNNQKQPVPGQEYNPPAILNNVSSVDVYFSNPTYDSHNNMAYGVTSTATSPDNTQTTVRVKLASTSSPYFFHNLATSLSGVDFTGNQSQYSYSGPIVVDSSLAWPTQTVFEDFYNGLLGSDYNNLPGYTKTNPLDPANTPNFPTNNKPVKINGDLDIGTNTANTTLTLATSNIYYITGNLSINSAKPFTLNLNNSVIFVDSGSLQPNYAAYIDSSCTLTGNGLIIVIGDVWFKPNMDAASNNFVFVMSANGTVSFQPIGDFYGSVAGNISVGFQQGNNPAYTWTFDQISSAEQQILIDEFPPGYNNNVAAVWRINNWTSSR